MNYNICEITYVHEEKATHAKQELLKIDTTNLSNMFKILSEPNRLQIIYMLHTEHELCVCDIANILNTTVATASHHLNTLKKLDVVTSRKEGKLVYYSLKKSKFSILIEASLNIESEEL